MPVTEPNSAPQRYFLRLAYNGTPFHGWQRQPGQTTVQQVIEENISKIFGIDTPIVGAGRTDAGVNAAMMMAHFDAPGIIMNPDDFLYRLNAMSGRDIAFQALIPVHPGAHARFDATARTYHYYACTHKSPFAYPLCWQAPPAIDFDLMNSAAGLLLEVNDFTSFAKLHTDTRTNICRVTEARWHTVDGRPGFYTFTITADRFLRNMVRAVVGTLVEVGRGKLTIDGFRAVIESRDRCAAGTSMPPHPLFLWHVAYPYIPSTPNLSAPDQCMI